MNYSVLVLTQSIEFTLKLYIFYIFTFRRSFVYVPILRLKNISKFFDSLPTKFYVDQGTMEEQVNEDVSEPQFIYSEASTSSWTPFASFIFPDFKALDVLGLHHIKNVVYEETEVSGFEIYIVEQWTAERKLSTLITSYTGNSQDKVSAVRVLLPNDSKNWPSEFQDYYNELICYSRPKKIKDNTLFITDLSSVPSTLNLLPIECGDFRQVWNNFKINYNLKRLRCVGRSALLLNGLFTASGNKFAQLYKIPVKTHSEKIDNNYLHNKDSDPDYKNLLDAKIITDDYHNKFSTAALEKDYSTIYPIIELVTIIQTCLTYFGLFEPKRKDGLLCNYTKKAINEWWNLYGKCYLSVTKPRNEATMGPTTVASIISLILSCFFKLMIMGFISSKEPFDENEFFTAIYSFQKKFGFHNKSEKICLDEYTMEKLFELSAKVSSTDIFNFKTRFKLTFQDIAGKGNFIQLSSDILTSDLYSLVQNFHYGKLAIIWKSISRTKRELLSLRKRDFIDVSFNNGHPREIMAQQQIYFDKLRKEIPLQITNSPFSNQHTSYLSMKSLAQGKDVKRTFPQNTNNNSSTIEHTLDESYKKEYYRRNSISSPNITELTHVDDQREFNRVHRSNSISKISDVIEAWSLPFDSSVVKVARNMLKIQILLEHEKTKKNEESIINAKLYDGSTSSKLKDPYFQDCFNKMQNKKTLYAKHLQLFRDSFERVENKNLLIKHDIKELDSLSSQLKYNIRILTTRVRDVEVNVKRFDDEIENIKSKLTKLENKIVDDMSLINNMDALNNYTKQMVSAEETKYQGFFIRLIKTNFLYDIQKDVKRWLLWAFEGIIYSKEQNSTTNIN